MSGLDVMSVALRASRRRASGEGLSLSLSPSSWVRRSSLRPAQRMLRMLSHKMQPRHSQKAGQGCM